MSDDPGELGWPHAAAWTLFAFGAALGLQLVIATVLVVADDLSWIEAMAQLQLRPAALAMTNVAAYGCVALALTQRRGRRDEGIDIVLDGRPVVVALALVLGAALAFPLAEIGNAVHAAQGHDGDRALALQHLLEPQSFGRGAVLVAALVLLVPVAEESFFRGALYSGLAERYGERGAVIGSAVLFALVHVRLDAIAPALVAGVLLGVLRAIFRSALPGVFVHAGVNAVPLLLPRRLAVVPGFNDASPVPSHVPIGLLLASVAIVLGALVMLSRYAKVPLSRSS